MRLACPFVGRIFQTFKIQVMEKDLKRVDTLKTEIVEIGQKYKAHESSHIGLDPIIFVWLLILIVGLAKLI